ncbi:MAG: hypothetical protein K7J46_21920, partial [Bryobacter sp.]|nr:hypothetical protein [Bryobacter sp. CoA8 C33]
KAKVLKPASSDLLFQSRGRSGWQWQGTAVAGPPKQFLRFLFRHTGYSLHGLSPPDPTDLWVIERLKRRLQSKNA